MDQSHSANYSTDMVSFLPLIHQGKVRDSFLVDEDHMLIVASDRRVNLIHTL